MGVNKHIADSKFGAKSTTLVNNLLYSAKRWPDREAYRCGSQALSFAQLRCDALHIAESLQTQGVRTGAKVGIVMNRGLDAVRAIYAVLLSGAAYVPIDPNSPLNRIVMICRQCDLQLICCSDKILDTLSKAQDHEVIAKAVAISALRNAGDSQLDSDLDRRCDELATAIQPAALAYIIFTSGTTGEPKGITHTHESACSFVDMMRVHFDVSCDDVIFATSAYHFDMSTFDLFVSDSVGASSIIATEVHNKMPASLTKLLEDSLATIWYATPTAISLAINFGAPERRDFSALRRLVYAGEPYPPKDLYMASQWLSNARISNAYGPAETNVTHIFDIPSTLALDEFGGAIPIGTSCANVEAVIEPVDEDCPSKGELCLSTPSLMQGYVNSEELNRQKLFLSASGDRFYRTGDLVECDESGLFHFLGRVDRQVKIRGVRIELEEIEHAVSLIDGVLQCAVSVLDADETSRLPGQSMRLVADIQIALGASLCSTEITAALNQTLPAHAIPDEFALHAQFPLAPTGKVDRQKLAQSWR